MSASSGTHVGTVMKLMFGFPTANIIKISNLAGGKFNI